MKVSYLDLKDKRVFITGGGSGIGASIVEHFCEQDSEVYFVDINKKESQKLIKLIDFYKEKISPTMPINANVLMTKFNIPEGKILGNKLKMIEEMWVQNGFQISEKQIQKIVKS